MVMDGMPVLTEVEEFCKKNKLLHFGEHILLACSGGPDSLALVDIFLRLRSTWDLQLSVAHFEHGIRGAASRDDAAFVLDFCRGQGLPCYCESADVPLWAAKHHASLETAARKLRYAFLYRIASQAGAGCIATAHHADDQAETVLMRIFRGTGTEGLAAIRPRRGRLIRPFLGVTRAAIEAYCFARSLKPRHDVTNDELTCTRNRLRLSLLPLLRTEYNPEITQALCRTAEIAAAECDYLKHLAFLAGRRIFVKCDEGPDRVSCQPFAAVHLALQRLLLRQWIMDACGSLRGIGFEHLESVRELILHQQTGTEIQLPAGWQVRIRYGYACMHRAAQRLTAPDIEKVRLVVPGLTMLTELGISIEARLLSQLPEHLAEGEIVCDYAQIHLPLLVRGRCPGDRLFLEQGRKKLKDFFIDEKIPREQRNHIPLVCIGPDILWVVGYRRSRLARATVNTRQFLLLRAIKSHKERGN